METKIVKGYGCKVKVIMAKDLLSEKEVEAIVAYSMDLTFDFLRYADEVEIACTRVESGLGEIEVVVSGSSESDERGNGYFGYPMSLKELEELQG